jgi:hypothetical protein
MNKIVIVGCNFSGLYSAIKCIDNGINVIIVEKNSMPFDEIINYKIFNKNHSYYIQLLNRLSIKYIRYNLNFNERILLIINNIINKAKHIPSKFLYMQTFDKLCYTLLSYTDYNYLKNNINKYNKIYCNMSALYAIYLFNNDLNYNNEYYIVEDDCTIIIDKMLEYLYAKNVIIEFNTDIRDIYIDIEQNITLVSKYKSYITKAIILNLSKENLLRFKFITKNNRRILNSVTKYNIDCNNIYNDNDIINEHNIQNHLINNLNIVYPIKKSSLYLWNVGINNVIVKEKIKNLYNNIFICSDAYSKNIFFANYTLELYEEIQYKINNIIKNDIS